MYPECGYPRHSRPSSSQHAVQAAFDEVRLASEGQATVLVYLLEVLRLIRDSLDGALHTEAVEVLTRQAALVAEVGERSDLPPADHDRVRSAFRARFG